MITTFNGCYRSEIKVKPSNWNTKKASTKEPWRINYRFYDPAFKDHPKFKKGKQVKVLGMNHIATLEERQAITRGLIEKEKLDLDKKGYNPITKAFMAPTPADVDLLAQDLNPTTSIITALNIVFNELTGNIEPCTKRDIEGVLKYFGQSAARLKKDRLPLKDVKARDIKLIMDNCKNLTVTRVKNKQELVKGKLRTVIQIIDGKRVPVKETITSPKIWNDNEFNKQRKYLSILFTELERQEIIEYSPIKKIPKRDTAIEDPDQVKRKVLSAEDRRKIHLALINDFPSFLRWINIFYHSGSRIREIMAVQGKNVDLAGQRFKVLIKKRKKWVWVWKTIKDKALPYWQEAMKGCRQEDYVFSRSLEPGHQSIRVDQIYRRWNRHIQKKLGIDTSVYPLKHLHTTETINELEKLQDQFKYDPVQIAAEHNSHTSGAMVVKIYDVDADNRAHKKVKGLKNTFAG